MKETIKRCQLTRRIKSFFASPLSRPPPDEEGNSIRLLLKMFALFCKMLRGDDKAPLKAFVSFKRFYALFLALSNCTCQVFFSTSQFFFTLFLKDFYEKRAERKVFTLAKSPDSVHIDIFLILVRSLFPPLKPKLSFFSPLFTL
jgi:hypothetical protein